MILFGEDALRNSIRDFLDHFHQNTIVKAAKPIDQSDQRNLNSEGRIERRKRLGGLLNYYSGGVRIGLLLPTAAARSIAMLA